MLPKLKLPNIKLPIKPQNNQLKKCFIAIKLRISLNTVKLVTYCCTNTKMCIKLHNMFVYTQENCNLFCIMFLST